MGILISVLIQFAIVFFIVSKVRKHVPGAKVVSDAYPGLVAVALFLVAADSIQGRKYIGVFPFMFAGAFFVIFLNKFYSFLFSLLTGEWPRSWIILDSFAVICIFLGSMSSEMMSYAREGGWLLGLLIIPFLLATIAFELSRAITSRLYFSAKGKIKVIVKITLLYSYAALGLFSHFALNHLAGY